MMVKTSSKYKNVSEIKKKRKVLKILYKTDYRYNENLFL